MASRSGAGKKAGSKTAASGAGGYDKRKKDSGTGTSALDQDPPIVVSGGNSVEITLDASVFQKDPGDPNKHKNPTKQLVTLVVTDAKVPPTVTYMTVDLQALVPG
ncbi:MAG TPA: hypothetical protein VF507_09260, partial [Pyrinomonadaceae bacterium]